MLKTTIVGNRDIAGRFTSFVDGRRQASRQANRETAAEVIRRWRQYTRSRRIARNLQAISQGDARIVISVDSSIGFNPVFEEYDTRPHIIEVRDKQVLTDGTNFFGRRVKHPGTTGSHAGRRAVREARVSHKQRVAAVWNGGGA